MGIAILLSFVAACIDVDDLDARAHVALRFETNVATPIAGDDVVLDALAADVAHSAGPICVLGATDEVGGDDDNLALGSARAGNVIDALVARGVDRDRFSWQSVGEHRLGRSVVVVFDRPVPVPTEVDVLDLPTVPADVDVDYNEEDEEPPRKPRRVAKKKPPPSPTRAFIDGLEPEWRRPAGALVVAAGGACGAGLGLGLCCVAPFTAPLGVTFAARAVDEVAEQDALGGAGVGAVVGGFGVLAAIGIGAGVIYLSGIGNDGSTDDVDSNSPLFATATFVAIPTTVIAGAGVGAAIGWWNSPSGRALATP